MMPVMRQRLERDLPPIDFRAFFEAAPGLFLVLRPDLIIAVFARRPWITLLVATHGTRGIELAREQNPGLILLDLHLPDMPGREVLRLLRSDPTTRGIPVLVVSADASPGQSARLHEDGATGYLTKPLNVNGFLAEVDEILACPAST
jgi:CheY-like chemotaxis protein